jgi:two-component system, NtrC family, nitrogen regulation sensor histidine kinase NtrY
MGFDRSFMMGVVLRLALIFGCGAAALYLATLADHFAATAVMALCCGGAITGLLTFVSRSNKDMTRFVDALASSDLAQSFSARHADGHFAELATSLQGAMDKQRAQDQSARQQALMLGALIDDAPVALLQLNGDKLELLNKMARRLLGSTASLRLGEFHSFGDDFVQDIKAIQPGMRKLTTLRLDGAIVRAMMTASQLRSRGADHLVISLQPIQNELDAAEMTLSRDLVRILTHEIMNSLTPVTSLAKTASVLMQAIESPGTTQLTDARAAVETVARRSESLMQFVRSYRALTVSPAVHRQSIVMAALLDEMSRLFKAEWPESKVKLRVLNEADATDFSADPDLIGQLLINLLRNAAEAAIDFAQGPAVTLRISGETGGTLLFDVEDNGPGIAPDKLQDIFLPFFTTKASGTGVGLSLSRQIAVAHGGSLNIASTSTGKTCMRLQLP